MPASLRIFVLRAVSVPTIASSCSGVVAVGIEPCLSSFSATSGILSTVAMSWLTLFRMGLGVPAGASTANQESYLYSGTAASAMVGTFGSWVARLAELMATGRTLLVALSSMVAGIGAKYICTSPRTTAVVASGAPRNGTWTMLIFACCLKISAER